VPGDPYSDPLTGVLFSKLGLATIAVLESAEREITHAALIWLHESPVTPMYDLHHLREIHRRIFGDVRCWARSGAGDCSPFSALPSRLGGQRRLASYRNESSGRAGWMRFSACSAPMFARTWRHALSRHCAAC
jgi:hypothetical protein